MEFLENVSNAGGEKVVRGMLNATNDNYLAGEVEKMVEIIYEVLVIKPLLRAWIKFYLIQ